MSVWRNVFLLLLLGSTPAGGRGRACRRPGR